MSEKTRIRELVQRNLGLVKSIASTIYQSLPSNTDLEDLISYGQLGLAEAAAEFDEGKGVRFSTYAYYRIRGAILDGAYQMSWYNRSQIRRLRFEAAATEALRAQRDSEDRNVDPLDSTLRAITRMVVVGLATDAAESEARRLSDPSASVPEEALANQEANEILRETVQSLPQLERDLIQATYFEGDTLAGFAKRFGKHKSWASRLHGKALDHLASEMKLAGVSD